VNLGIIHIRYYLHPFTLTQKGTHNQQLKYKWKIATCSRKL